MSSNDHDDARRAARRAFLTKCGKFAAVTPAAITLLMSVSKQSFAVATSGGGVGGRRGNNGFGNRGRDGIPGRSGGKGKGKRHGPIGDKDR